MSDFDMTPEMARFETRLSGRLEAYAAIPVTPVDAREVARGAIGTGRRRGLLGRGGIDDRPAAGPVARPLFGSTTLLIVLTLLLTLALAVLVAANLNNVRPKPLVDRNGLIAYSISDIPTRPYNHIRLMNSDGTNDREIAQGAHPQFSADGKWLTYFTGFGFETGNLKIVRASADGSEPREVIDYGQTGYLVSPDATQLLMRLVTGRRQLSDDLWLVDLTDGSRRMLIPAPSEPDLSHQMVAWSPDGDTVALAVMRQVSAGENAGEYRVAFDLIDVETGEARRFSDRPGTQEVALAWSPDSQHLAYAGLPDGAPLPRLAPDDPLGYGLYPSQDIFVIKADGSADTNVSESPDSEAGALWSPDSATLTFTAYDRETIGLKLVLQQMGGGDRSGPPRYISDIEGLQHSHLVA